MCLSKTQLKFILLMLALVQPTLIAEPLNSAVETTLQSQDSNVQSQQAIDALADSTRTMEQEYKTILHSMDGLVSYNNQLEILVNNQKDELASIEKQLGYIEETQRDIVPLMLRMIDVLAEFIQLDLPFLTDERQERMALIKSMMDRADVSLPDKFRRIMEAYQIEMEYGRTIEAYEDAININGNLQTVDILRIGRLALIYSTLDRAAVGRWDPETKQWVELEGHYAQGIQYGLKIAKNQAPPDLFKIPVPAPEVTQ